MSVTSVVPAVLPVSCSVITYGIALTEQSKNTFICGGENLIEGSNNVSKQNCSSNLFSMHFTTTVKQSSWLLSLTQ